MLAADDVVDLVWEASVVFRDEAVFATVAGALGYFRAESVANVTGHKIGFGELSPWPFSECAPTP
jgi:hypothetical protein